MLCFVECKKRSAYKKNYTMEDRDIIELFWHRNEDAIYETDTKYHSILFNIAYNILMSRQDCEEVLNDVYFKVWNIIPPYRPLHLGPFLIKITRELSIDCLRSSRRQKRIPHEICVPIEELEEIISGKDTPEEIFSASQLSEAINTFLQGIKAEDRRLFVHRYIFAESIFAISQKYGMNEARVKTKLYRVRQKLKNYLKKEGFDL